MSASPKRSSSTCPNFTYMKSGEQALDLRVSSAPPRGSTDSSKETSPNSSDPSCKFTLSTPTNGPGSNTSNANIGTQKNSVKKQKKPVNQFLKHKLKYRYLQRHKKQNNSGDSGAFGSSTMQGSTSTSSFGKTSESTPSLSSYTSSSPRSGTSSESPVNMTITNETNENNQELCMIMRQAVPLILVVQDQMQNKAGEGSEIILLRCNVCNLFTNNLQQIVGHVQSCHSDVKYCFVCSKFFNTTAEYDDHRLVCNTAHKALKNIIDGHYMEHYNKNANKDQPLNLTTAGTVALRAAQMIHNKRGRRSKIKKLLKCTYCKKAFFGRFYLQRHLRSHTGEKLCYCSVCGKGFAEWRNLRNHMSRFHTSSETDSGGQSKSVSPNNSSESDMIAKHAQGRPLISNQSAEFSDAQSLKTDYPYMTHNGTTSRPPSSDALHNYRNSMTASIPQQMKQLSSPTEIKTEVSPSSTLPTSQSSSANSSSNTLSSATTIESKPGAASLGFTSSRLEIRQDEQDVESSLQMIVDSDGKKFFQCKMCSKKFQTKFAMQRHLDFHADKRPFQCDQCDYKAKTKPQLKVHLMRHTGKKGFHCSICSYSCVTHSDLNRHCKSRSHLFRVAVLEGHPASSSTTTSTAASNHPIFSSNSEYNPS